MIVQYELFREIPKPMMSSRRSEGNGDPDFIRQKSLKQHKGIRVFGEHVAANSNEHICNSSI